MKLNITTKRRLWCSVAFMLLCLFACITEASAQSIGGIEKIKSTEEVQANSAAEQDDSKPNHRKRTKVVAPAGSAATTAASDSIAPQMLDMSGDTVHIVDMDSIQKIARENELLQLQLQARKDSIELAEYGKERVMKINPTRALWLSALCPGLGQAYNRRYWKLPIVVGGFVGMGYAISWNNKMLKDYTKAYADIMDNDPATNSYMDFYPPTVSESDIDRSWLEKTLKSKKDYFRRNRDLCVIGIVGVYLIAMVDAYVDASLAKFDISDDLSMKVKPTLLEQNKSNLPGVGVACAFNF